jgi:hypothetical protein
MNPKEINEYLFYEFGFDLEDDESIISEDWPFKLKSLGTLDVYGKTSEVFSINHLSEEYYIYDVSSLTCITFAGMSLEDIAFQEIGSSWINEQGPIDLNHCRIGDNSIPSLDVRINKIKQIAKKTFDFDTELKILEGLYLKKTKDYLSLIEHNHRVSIIGRNFKVENVPFPKASPWRRLCFSVGKLVHSNKLS